MQWEAKLIREEFYADQAAGGLRFIPVVLPGQSPEGIPTWRGRAGSTRYTVPEFTVTAAEPLLRYLSGQPGVVEPPLGPLPVLPPRVIGSVPAAGTATAADGPVRPVHRSAGLRTEVVFRVRVDGADLLTETAVAGTVIDERRAAFPVALLSVWEVLSRPALAAAAAVADAGTALAGC